MKVYLNVSCLNRPFDDQTSLHNRLESEGVSSILDRCERGEWSHVSSEIARIEIDAMPDAARRFRVRQLLPEASAILELSDDAWKRGMDLEKLGFKPADALHVAAAEEAGANLLLSCDDRFCRLGWRHRLALTVVIANPLDWLKEIEHADDA